MAYEELFTDLLKAEREEDVTGALTVFGLEKFSDSNGLRCCRRDLLPLYTDHGGGAGDAHPSPKHAKNGAAVSWKPGVFASRTLYSDPQ
jgi:hypothetical protein